MQCRQFCGACCIAPSITSLIPGMPNGKAANVACIQLDENFACRIFHDPARPAVCSAFQPCPQVCGENREHALENLLALENLTK